MKPAACARCGGALDLRLRRVRPPVGDVLGDGRAEQERVVVDDADRAAQRRQVDRAHVGAVDQHGALAHVVEPREQLDQRGLAGAGRADERHRRAGLDDEVDVRQGGPRRALVAEGDVAQLDPAAALRERRRTRRCDEPRGAVEDLEQPRAGGRRALGEPEHDAERPHRPDQQQQVGVEGGEVAERERPVDHLAAAEEQDHGQPDARQEADERVVERPQARRDHRLVEDPLRAALEAPELARLGGERLDDAHARDVLLDVGGQLGDPLLDLLQRGPRAAPVARGDQHDERHGEQRERGQHRVDEEHRDRREQDRQAALGDEHEAVAEEEAHRLQVDRGARHQLPGLLAVEERELERLEVDVEQVAQVELDRQRHPAGDQPARDRDPEPDHGDAARSAGRTAAGRHRHRRRRGRWPVP